jgi:hypothetical protein
MKKNRIDRSYRPGHPFHHACKLDSRRPGRQSKRHCRGEHSAIFDYIDAHH